MSRSSLAVSTDHGAEFGEQRVVTLRVFRHHIHRLGLLVFTEAAIAGLAVYAAIFIRFSGFSSTLRAFEANMGPLWPKAALIAAVFVLSMAGLGLYQLRHRARFLGVFVRLVIALLAAELALALIFYLAPSLDVGRGVLALTGAFAFIGLALSRYLFLRVVDEELFKRRVLVWGAGKRAASIGKRLRRRTDQRGFRIVAYVPAPGDEAAGARAGPVVPSSGDLVRLALHHKVEEIVVATDDRRRGFPTAELLECRLRGIHVTDLLGFLESESGRVNVELVKDRKSVV